MYVCYLYFNKDQSISQSINDNAQLFTAKRRSTENGTGSCSYENVNNTLADDIGSLSLSLSLSLCLRFENRSTLGDFYFSMCASVPDRG